MLPRRVREVEIPLVSRALAGDRVASRCGRSHKCTRASLAACEVELSTVRTTIPRALEMIPKGLTCWRAAAAVASIRRQHQRR